MPHVEQQVSALEKTLREEAKTNWDGYQEVGDLTCQYAAECLDKAADMVRERDKRLCKLLEEFEIDAALQNDEENSQYYDCAKRLRALLEAEDAP